MARSPAELEALIAKTRQTLLTIWDGDAAAADKQLCAIMQHLRTTAPPDLQEWMLPLLARLIQREG